MTCIEHKTFIDNTYRSVRTFSSKEKKNLPGTNQLVNEFLDGVLELESLLQEKTDKINEVNQLFEQLTWYNNLDPDCLMRVNETIGKANELHRTLLLQYISLEPLRRKGVAKSKVKAFKLALDDLHETCQDVEMVFFILPADDEFVKTTNELNLV